MIGTRSAHSPVPDSMCYGVKMRKSNIYRRHILTCNPSHPVVGSGCLGKDSIFCHQTALFYTLIFRRIVLKQGYIWVSIPSLMSSFSP